MHEALKLHAMHYFMSVLITFTAPSGQKMIQHLPSEYTSSNLGNFPASRLLNRQIKQVMSEVQRDATANVLASLEKSLRGRTRDCWAPSFSVILILCLCMENLETAADTMVVCDQLREDGRRGFQRTQSAEACQKLESVPFAQCKDLLHDIYHSNKESNGGAKNAGFNPLRALYNQKDSDLEGKADDMVNGVFEVIRDNCKFIQIDVVGDRD